LKSALNLSTAERELRSSGRLTGEERDKIRKGHSKEERRCLIDTYQDTKVASDNYGRYVRELALPAALVPSQNQDDRDVYLRISSRASGMDLARSPSRSQEIVDSIPEKYWGL
jgi:hypothetical protein